MGNSWEIEVFYKQKNIIRIVAGSEGRICSDMSCQQILSVLFLVDNMDKLRPVSVIQYAYKTYMS